MARCRKSAEAGRLVFNPDDQDLLVQRLRRIAARSCCKIKCNEIAQWLRGKPTTVEQYLKRLIEVHQSGKANPHEQNLVADELKRLAFPEEYERQIRREWELTWDSQAGAAIKERTKYYKKKGTGRRAGALAKADVAEVFARWWKNGAVMPTKVDMAKVFDGVEDIHNSSNVEWLEKMRYRYRTGKR
jgi:hypothetical protein